VGAPSPRPGSVWFDVLDVGQGLSAIVRTAHHVLVFDTGPAFSSDADSGSRIVVPYLRGEGVSRVDAVIVSHDDRDHSGGTESLLQATPVGWVASPLPAGDPRLALARRTLRCFAGQRWEWDGVRFEMLHPSWASYNKGAARDNDRSCVLRVVASGGSVLLTADIERAAEAQLLERAAAPLPADVLVVPHHGSATSSSDAFVERVQPRIAIVPVGHRNRFGHPAAAILERYARAGAAIYRTDRDGAVLVRLEKDITVRTWRGLRRRYWQGR
jgi:competence protein ComEC